MTFGRLANRLGRLPRLNDRLSDRLSDSNLLGFSLIAFGFLSVVSLVWIFGFADGPGDLLYQWTGLLSLSFCLFFISRIAAGLVYGRTATIGPLRRKIATGLLAFAWLVCLPVFLMLYVALGYRVAGISGALGSVGFLALLLCIALLFRRYSGVQSAAHRSPQRERRLR